MLKKIQLADIQKINCVKWSCFSQFNTKWNGKYFCWS